MITLTLAQESLLDRIRVCCLCSPKGQFSGTYERLCRAIQEIILPDFMQLIASGAIGFALLNEEWNLWVIAQGRAI